MGNINCVNAIGWKNAQAKTIQTLKLKRLNREEMYYNNPTTCNYCDKVLSYDKRKYKFCSHTCSAIKANIGYNRHRGESVKDRNCLNCGGSLNGKPYKAKYCNNTCSGEHNTKIFLDYWLTKGMFEKKPLYGPGRRYYLSIRGMKCEECGWDKINPTTGKSPLNVDHIDGDCTNNIPENIKVLCPSCHSLTPTYGSLNKGKSKRVKRYKVRQE